MTNPLPREAALVPAEGPPSGHFFAGSPKSTDFTQSETALVRGVSEQEALERLKQEGPNELPSSKPRGFFQIAWEVVREPMFLLLLGAGGIYLLLGDTEEALLLLGFVFVIMGITLYQERKTERALAALKDLSSPRALVIRDGQQRRIPGREVVRGDVIVLSEGSRVPADASLFSSINLSVDESLLTGESVPVRKEAAESEAGMGRPGGDDLPFVYSGTLVVQGQGIARVGATGLHTELGKIGKSCSRLRRKTPRCKKRLVAWSGFWPLWACPCAPWRPCCMG